jgi:hypothetical protein
MTSFNLFGEKIEDDSDSKVSFAKAINFFEETVKTEGAFFIRFEELPLEYLACLRSYYNTDKDWKIFKEIKKFWKIK